MNLIEDIIDETVAIMNHSRKDLSPEKLTWKRGQLDNFDLRTLEEEFSGMGAGGGSGAGGNSPFDPLQIRQKAWTNWQEGKIDCSVFEGEFGKIVGFFPAPQSVTENDIPFFLWSWILAAFAPRGVYVRIYFVGSDIKRRFPVGRSDGKIGPENINGGYCYPCRKQLAVFVFRAEDATRVLIHELLHAFCTDRFECGLDLVEARTETWAEVIWCCFMAGGDKKLARKFIGEQAAWVYEQNKAVADFIGDAAVQAREFPWRYTIGRESILRRWLAGQKTARSARSVRSAHESLRLTSPYVAEQGARILEQPEKLI
jgi:hypothetical protein